MTDPQQPASPSGPAPRATLSRELGEFLIEFSIAINKFAMYPGGHPSLQPSVEGMVRRLQQLLQDRGTLSVGVARQQLIIEGVATAATNPVLKELAGRLHRHHLGAITFGQGVELAELVEFVSKVSTEADRTEPLGLMVARLTAWPHVRMYPLMYDRLELLDDQGEEQARADDPTARSQRTRAAQLWVGMARAALAAGEQPAGADAPRPGAPDIPIPTDPASVAQAIEGHPRGTAYDQVIVGYMLQIAEELRSSGGAEAAQLKKRMSRLVSTLDPRTLGRLMEMGGDGMQRRQFLMNASQGMAVDAVLDLLNAASSTQEQTVSHSMLRMLQKMARHADGAAGPRSAAAEQSVRDQVAELIKGWSLKDPNPGAYAKALESLSAAAPVFAGPTEAMYIPEPKRIVQMALEVDALGEPLTRAITHLLEKQQLTWLLETVKTAPGSSVSSEVWQRIATPAQLADVLRAEPLDVPLMDTILPHLGLRAADVLLDALMESGITQTRRILLDRIVGLGFEVGPPAVQRLADERWYVRRNMLRILGDLETLPSDLRASEHLEHPDPRVRREALRIVLRDPASRERAICRALTDSDERIVRAALAAAQQSCPPAALPLVASRALSATEDDHRVMAIRVLGSSGNRSALDPLLALAAPRKGLFGPRTPPKTAVYLAAVAALRSFASDARAKEILDHAAQSKDAEIALAATGSGTG